MFATSFLEKDKTVNMQPVNACWINLYKTKWKQKCTQLSIKQDEKSLAFTQI